MAFCSSLNYLFSVLPSCLKSKHKTGQGLSQRILIFQAQKFPTLLTHMQLKSSKQSHRVPMRQRKCKHTNSRELSFGERTDSFAPTCVSQLFNAQPARLSSFEKLQTGLFCAAGSKLVSTFTIHLSKIL